MICIAFVSALLTSGLVFLNWYIKKKKKNGQLDLFKFGPLIFGTRHQIVKVPSGKKYNPKNVGPDVEKKTEWQEYGKIGFDTESMTRCFILDIKKKKI